MATYENANLNSILTEDLISDILSRLPVTTLLLLKCVCKSWLSLISASDFIKTHLSKSDNDTQFTSHHLIMSEIPFINHIDRRSIGVKDTCEYLRLEGCSVYSLLNESSVAEAIELDYPMKDIDRFTYVVGSCNGLVCLASYDGSAFLWNPTTRKSRKLPELEYEHSVCGFGYDKLKDDYKVFAWYGKNQVSVYSLRSDCWRMIDNLNFCEVFETGKLAHGALHWKKSDSIVSLDIATEMCREIMLPEYEENSDWTLNTLGEHLCVLYYIGYTHADFWIMNEYGVEESWTKLFTQSYMDEDTPLNPRLIPISFIPDGDIMMSLESEIIRYNPKDDTFEDLIFPVGNLEGVEIFVESLVSLDL